MRYIRLGLVVALIATFALVAASTSAEAPTTTTVQVAALVRPQVLRHGCKRVYSRQQFKSYARRAYRWRKIGRHGQRRLWDLQHCQRTDAGERWAKHYRRKLKTYRWRRQHPWEYRRNQLSAGTKAMLKRLRGCETRGIPYPSNYRYTGAHDGAYQYTVSTWHRAGGSGRASWASPAEQDVRTARFFPSHRSEWACSA